MAIGTFRRGFDSRSSQFAAIPMTEIMLEAIMLEELERSIEIVRSGAKVFPRWRIWCADEDEHVIVTQFANDDEEGTRTIRLLSRFMAWRLATSYIMAGETWLGSENAQDDEALICVAAARESISGAMRRIRREPSLAFGEVEWLTASEIGDEFRRILPTGASKLEIEELELLEAVFGKGGEMEATKIA
jgi:hypothetical protein